MGSIQDLRRERIRKEVDNYINSQHGNNVLKPTCLIDETLAGDRRAATEFELVEKRVEKALSELGFTMDEYLGSEY